MEIVNEKQKEENDFGLTGHRKVSWKHFKTAIENYTSQKFNKKCTVLDIGCKDIQFKKPIESLGFSWIGVDRNRIENVVTGTMESIPFSDDAFKFVFCSHAFEHTEHPIDVLNEFKRVSSPLSMIFIVTPYPSYNQIHVMDSTHVLIPTPLQMERFFNYVGITPLSFTVDKNSSDDEDDWCLVSVGVNKK